MIKCRKCHIFFEIIDVEVAFGCQLLTSVKYTNKRNAVARIIHLAK